MRRIPLEQLIRESKAELYPDQYQYIRNLIEQQKIKPVKASPLNGKSPALHQSYWLIEDTPDFTDEIRELQFELVPAIRIDYYLNHPDIYRREKKWVRLLNRYFLNRKTSNPQPVSLNERSFQIWGREKFLQKEQGRKILAHCGISIEQLFVYSTTEPLAYYSADKSVPQTILILENKDTFYSMRRFLLSGQEQIFGETIGTVIYGAGKGILRSFEDFTFCVEPHINDSRNKILYFGDLDYEGIGIYERLERLFYADCQLGPFTGAYEKMIQKAEAFGMDALPESSANQNHNLSGAFFSYFSREIQDKMNRILSSGSYIPQEIVNITDFDKGEPYAI